MALARAVRAHETHFTSSGPWLIAANLFAIQHRRTSMTAIAELIVTRTTIAWIVIESKAPFPKATFT